MFHHFLVLYLNRKQDNVLEKIFYVFPIDVNGFSGTSPIIMGIDNSSVPITQPLKLYPMIANTDGYQQFILTQGSPSRHIIICKYMDGEINSVGSYSVKLPR